MTDKLLKDILPVIKPASKDVAEQAQKRLDSLTKPRGSLGRLEECAVKYAAARGELFAEIKNPMILVFAGDHGVAEEGVSAYPQEVTPQMVANFSSGGAAINSLARHAGAEIRIIDIGVAAPCDFEGVTDRKIAPGTANFVKGPAMTIEQTVKALKAGMDEAELAVSKGSTIIATGDMGIANTTPSTALYSAFLDIPPEEITGMGTGIDKDMIQKKATVIKKALEVNREQLDCPLNILAALGGFEIAGICGAVIGAAALGVPSVIDGFISGAAALCAIRMDENIADYCFFSHLSAESGHRKALETLGVRPILDLDMRLGEGTGAALALHVIEAGVKAMQEMATFEEAKVSKKDK